MLSLFDFVFEVEVDIEGFKTAYYEKHLSNPEGYPLSFDENNNGLWWEMFDIYCTTGEV